MRAVGVTEWGGPEALRIVELPEPEAGPGEVRIRVYAAAVNPTDTLLRDGSRAEALRDVPSPFVPGMDAAGVLDQIGPGVQTSLQVGDPVMAIVLPAGAHGAYAEQIVVPAESVVRTSQGASHAEAASLADEPARPRKRTASSKRAAPAAASSSGSDRPGAVA